MAYDKLCEGNRVYDAATGGRIYAADLDEVQDQLKAMLGPRWVNLTFSPTYDDPDSTDWYVVVGNEKYLTSSTSGDSIIWPIKLPVGCVITGVEVEVTGHTDSINGYLALLGYGVGDNLGGSDVLIEDEDITNGVTNVFDTGGTAYSNVVTYSTLSGPITIVDDVIYYIQAAPTSAHEVRIWNVKVQYQYGN